MKRLSVLILVFSICFLAFIIVPVFLGKPFPFYSLMKTADVLDLLTPLVLLPLYWSLFRLDGAKPAPMRTSLIFMLFSAFWVLGQGMHLAANSIGHLTEKIPGTDLFTLTNFYDEVLSHYLWHFGILALSATLIYQQWKNPLRKGRPLVWALALGGFFYGFTWFAMVVEGATSPMSLPFTVLAVLIILIWGRKNLRQKPVVLFFLISYLVALALFAIWGIWQQGLPEPSKVGFI